MPSPPEGGYAAKPSASVPEAEGGSSLDSKGLAPTWGPDSPAARHGDDDELGMQLSPELEDATTTFTARSTPVWPDLSASRASVGSQFFNREHPAPFGNYELLREVGRGGMGVVYKARQKGLDRLVAIKMILGSHLANADQVARFYAEARAAALLRDPHVVAIHDVGEIQGQHYFAMEFIDGPSLAQRLDTSPITPREAARLMAIMARAVGRLHQRGIVHRDLKPSNILLDRNGMPFVTDFGLAKMFSGDRPETYSNAIVGTPSYMSPEQASGRPGEVGPRSDVYSLGAILYEMLTGRPPFEERNPLDTLVQVLETEPTPPTTLRKEIPDPLEWITLKCLEKTPNDRYASAEELADDLDRFVNGEVVEARNMGVWSMLRRWSRREPSLVSRLSAMAICLSIVQLDQFMRERERSYNRQITILLGLGALASLSFQGLLKSASWANLARFAWATADVILLTVMMVIVEGLSTPLVAGFFILVVASGLWFQERLVWFTTTSSVIAYGVLVVMDRPRSLANPHLHVLFMALLAVSGLIIGYQVKRVRALSQYYEHRTLP